MNCATEHTRGTDLPQRTEPTSVPPRDGLCRTVYAKATRNGIPDSDKTN